MRALEFIIEGTEIFVGDDYVFAKRMARGKSKGPAIQMLITKNEWENIKHQQANTDRHNYDVATAEMIVKDMVNQGAEVIWKTAAEFNQDARDLENHRFKDHPDVGYGLSQMAAGDRRNAKQTNKSSLKTIK